ncbi:hypothetical protein D6853_01805 [Butyrivibrio sp. X503]|nr:hypothetical protein D6853_01805 [Butyrivibrio sp. X503]
MKIAAFCLVSTITFVTINEYSFASSGKVTSVLPQAGISYALGSNQVSLSNLQQSMEEDTNDSKTETSISGVSKSVVEDIESSEAVTDETPSASTITDSILRDIQSATGAVIDKQTEKEKTEEEEEVELFKTLVIAQVDHYVNVRDSASEDGEIVGKLYDKSVGTFIEEENGWYKIKSGKVEGYVKAEFCVTGDEAVELAKKVGTRMATVTTTTLHVRSGPSTDDKVIELIPKGDELVVDEELDGWVRVNVEEGEGYVSLDYVDLWTDFVKAESKAEEEARLAKEKAEREAANKAAKANTSKDKADGGNSGKSYNSAASYTTESSSIGSAVAQYAQQFVGNPYVYGGSSLTNGTDCSGFVMSVYANFGVSLPHSSGADRNVGSAVDGLANAQPGDIVCYSGHVGIYIGNGQIVHASTAKTGIKISDAGYRSVLAVRRIF